MSAGRSGGHWVLALHDRVTTAAFAIAAVALAVLLGAFVYEVVARYVFRAPTRWSSDVVQYALCVSAALALPTVTREGGHVALTSLVEKLDDARQAALRSAIVWTGVATLALATAIFVRVGIEQARQGVETVAAFAIPKWWLTAAVAYGLLDSTLHLLRQALGSSRPATGREIDV